MFGVLRDPCGCVWILEIVSRTWLARQCDKIRWCVGGDKGTGT